MRYIGLLFIALLALSSCSSDSSQTAVEKVEVSEDVVADSKSKLAVKGMVCSMGCVSAIQDKLRSTPGVASAVVNYEESYAMISFDSKMLDENQLIEAIGSIGDNSYSANPFEDIEMAPEVDDMKLTEEEELSTKG
tara:strand:+ start:12587 stop:12994 length:408 start_codon:yes stop_codon:yes gene_type:complete